MERFNVQINVNLLAMHEQDAHHLGRLLVTRLNDIMGNGQSVARVESVTAERTHSDCERIGICICDAKPKVLR